MNKLLQRGGLFLTLPTAAAVLVYALLFFVPNQRTIDRLRKDLRSRQSMSTNVQNMARTIQRLQQELSTTEAYLDRWQSHLPDANDTVRVQAEVTHAASEAGLLTTQVNPGEEIEYPSLITIPLKIEVEGDFREMLDFLHRLEELPYFIWTDSLRIEATRQVGGELEGELSLVVFHDRPEDSD